jgi:hypothetical protein
MEGLTWKEALLPVYRFRLGLIVALQIGTAALHFN